MLTLYYVYSILLLVEKRVKEGKRYAYRLDTPPHAKPVYERCFQALAALNGDVLALMDGLLVSKVASQMRHGCAHPEDALQCVFC